MSDAKLIKQLRDLTGAGFLDCKKALESNQNNIEESAKWLKDKGAIKAAKKMGRETNAGAVVVAISSDKKVTSIVEFQTETDFVTRNEMFQNFAREVSRIALTSNSMSQLMSSKLSTGESIEEKILEHIAIIGESIKIEQFRTISVEKGVIGFYVHNPIGNLVGNVAAIVALESERNDKQTLDQLEQLAQNLSVHVASMDPKYVSPEQIPLELLDNQEKEIRGDDAYAKKPAHVIDKIIENKITEFKNSLCLLFQDYILEQDMKVNDLISLEEKTIADKITVKEFVRFAVKR
jgi:elongation factor Ts